MGAEFPTNPGPDEKSWFEDPEGTARGSTVPKSSCIKGVDGERKPARFAGMYESSCWAQPPNDMARAARPAPRAVPDSTIPELRFITITLFQRKLLPQLLQAENMVSAAHPKPPRLGQPAIPGRNPPLNAAANYIQRIAARHRNRRTGR